jgi:glycosyltransferase involved in cell wall biosynthesis
MPAPLVSVILPTFNRLEFLHSAVDSVFSQTFTDWELIIADDGSEQQTQEYLRGLQSPPRVQLIQLRHSGNPGAVRNAALRAAAGQYVAFLDSDDVWMPTKLERQLAALRARPNCRWGYTGYIRVDESGRTRAYPGTKQWVAYRGAIFEELLAFEAEVSTPAVLVERQLVEELGGFDEEQWVYEDYDLWLRIALHNEIDLIDEPLIALRSHDQHYECADRRLPSRYRQLCKMHGLVTDSKLRRRVARLRARIAVDLAAFYADFDRSAAARTLLRSCVESWRFAHWWRALPRVSVKVLAPRALLGIYRRSRPGRGPASTQPQS